MGKSDESKQLERHTAIINAVLSDYKNTKSSHPDIASSSTRIQDAYTILQLVEFASISQQPPTDAKAKAATAGNSAGR